jgi:hypothetical protein
MACPLEECAPGNILLATVYFQEYSPGISLQHKEEVVSYTEERQRELRLGVKRTQPQGGER